MSTQFQPSADSAVVAAAVSIASSTNATPIVVTTTAPHLLAEGAMVQITGHTANLAANGVWRVHKTAADKVALLVPYTGANSVGSGVGGATGSLQSLDLFPTYPLPSDLDDVDAASVNPAFEALGDRAAFIGWRVLAARQWIDQFVDLPDATFAAWSTGSASNAGWTEDAACTTLISSVPDDDVINSDFLDVTLTTTFDTTIGGGGPVALKLFYCLYDYGTSPSFAGASPFNGSATRLFGNTSGPLVLTARTVVNPARGQRCRIYVGALGFAAGAVSYALKGDRAFYYRRGR